MNVTEAIKARRSIRKFENRPVEKEKIELLLRAAMQAPSAKNGQPWEFIVTENQDTLEKLSKTHDYSIAMKNGAFAIVVLANKNFFVSENSWQQDLAAASENILLEAVELGLGTTWMAIAPYEERMQYIKNLFSLPDNILPFNMIVVGYPAKEKEYENRYKENRIHYETY